MRLSVQLYTVRDALTVDLEGTLRKLRDIGLEFVELAGNYGRSAEDWRNLLDSIGLKVSGSHVGIESIEGEFEQVVSDARALGNDYVVVPWIGEQHYAQGWEAFGKRLEAIGLRLKHEGLNLAYHNHAFEFQKDAQGKTGLETLYDTTDPDLVKAELDVAWVQIGGGDPAEWVRRLSGRIPLIHLKDFDPEQKPQWRPGGEGKVDWNAVLDAAGGSGVKYAAIELDESAGDPIEAVATSYRFYSGKGLR